MTNYLGEEDGFITETVAIGDLTVSNSLSIGNPTSYSFTVDPPPGDSYILKSAAGVLEWDTDLIGVGDVTGPVSSQTGEICSFSSTSGKAITTSDCFASAGRASVGTSLIPGIALAVQSAAATDQFTELRTTTATNNSTLRFVHNSITKHNIKSDGNSDSLSIEDGSNIQRFAVTSSGVKHGAVGSDYTFPTARGTANQILIGDGAGGITWEDVPVSTIIRSNDNLTFAQANNGVFVADSEGTEFINATPLVTTFRGGGVDNPNIVLRSGLFSSYIQRSGRDILTFGGSSTRVGYDGDTFSEYTTNLKTGRINNFIRERVDLTTHSLTDASGVSRVGYDATKSYLGAPTATSILELTDASLTADLAGQERLNIDAAGATLADSVGQARLSHEATLTTLTNATGGTFLELGDNETRLSYNGINAVDLRSVVTYIRGGPAGFSELQLGGLAFGMDYRFNGTQRFKISGVASQLYSPDAQSEFDVRDGTLLGVTDGITRLELTATTNTIADASGVDRIIADASSTRMIAPSGGNKLDVATSGVISSGAFSVNTSNVNDIGVTVSAPPGQVANLQKWRVDGADVASVDSQGNGAFRNMFLVSDDLAGSVITNTTGVPMIINPSTASKLSLSYPACDTEVLGDLICAQALDLNGDFKYQKGAFEYKSANNAAVTNIAVANTPTKVVFSAGSSSIGYAQGFTVDIVGNIGRCTYNGNRRRVGHTGVSLSFIADQNNVTTTFYVYKNGALITGSKVKLFYTGSNRWQSTAIHIFADVVATDYLELYCEADATCNITVGEANLFGLMLPNEIP